MIGSGFSMRLAAAALLAAGLAGCTASVGVTRFEYREFPDDEVVPLDDARPPAPRATRGGRAPKSTRGTH